MKAKAEQNLYAANQGYVKKYPRGYKIKEDNMDAHVEKVLKEVEKMCRSVWSESPSAAVKAEEENNSIFKQA